MHRKEQTEDGNENVARSVLNDMKRVLIAIGLIVLLSSCGISDVEAPTVETGLTPAETMTVKAFFPNTLKNPEMMDCSLVYPVKRTAPKTKAVAGAAIEELLSGPTEEEKRAGYFTSINDGLELNSIRVEAGTAYADFDETLQYQVGGSCRISSIIAQINETLKQFSTVSRVVISINGESGDSILQP